jgi:hypothetical protein
MCRAPALALALPLVLALSACSEYGLGRDVDNDGLVDPDAPGSGDGEGAGPEGEARPQDDPLDPFPGEELPPGWPEWSSSCRTFGGAGIGGGAGIERYTIDEPIEALSVLLTVGDLDVVPRPGPVEVELHGVKLNGAQGPSVSNGRLTLDYSASVGDLVVYAPPDLLSYDVRLCVGDLTFAELQNHVVAEVRVGRLEGVALEADVVWTHNLTGDAEVEFAAAPLELWMDGATGQSDADIPADRCDCDLEVTGPGITELDGMADDAGAPLDVWIRRQVGTIRVSGQG